MNISVAVHMAVYVVIWRPLSALACSWAEVLCLCSGIELKLSKAVVQGEKVK